MNGTKDLMKEAPETPLLPPREDREKLPSCEPGRGPSPDTAENLGLFFLVSPAARNRCLLFTSHPVCGTLLRQPPGMRTGPQETLSALSHHHWLLPFLAFLFFES